MLRYSIIILLAILSACSSGIDKGELSGAINGTEANAASRGGTPEYLYGQASTNDELANSPLNNNISNTSAVHPYANIFP